jgi:hypothetical protein
MLMIRKKMSSEIAKYKKSRYDYETDPEGKFIPVNYQEQDDEKLYADAKKYYDIVEEWGRRDEDTWGSLVKRQSSIAGSLGAFRNNYKQMKMAENVTLVPLGLTFETADNPMQQFDSSLMELQAQLNALQETKPERVERIRKEMEAQRTTIKTVEDRINEWAAANEKYLEPQLVATDITPVEIPKPAPEETVMPAADKRLEENKKSKSGKPAPAKVKSIDEPTPAVAPVHRKESIKKQINALEMAMKFSKDDIAKNKIKKQITALTFALKFVA